MSTGASIPSKPTRGGHTAAPGRARLAWGSATAARLALALLLALAAWLGWRSLTAVPEVTPAGASPLVFSAERAMTHVRALTITPRPVGSAANAAVRDYLVSQIRALGVEPVVQSVNVLRHEPGFPEAHLMAVENVLARVPGTEPGSPALLVSGHYDSVATSVGAADCGACAATTLETMRAVVAATATGQPLRNDVIFLFTDAEEIGVAGAAGFMQDHPWAADVGLSLVFEGLGCDGAPLLYIAGPESGAVVDEALDVLGRETRYPLASSFLHDFMWTVAGNTGSDLDAFLEGAPGLGLIYLSLETVASYHSPADSAANLDPRSLQGMGDFALALTRHFGDRPLDELPAAPDLVAFPVAPGVVARYSSALALPLAGVALVLLLAALVVGLRRGQLTVKGVLAVFATAFLTILTAVLVASLAWWLARWLTPRLHNFTVGGWWGSGFYLAATLALALAVVVGWRAVLRRFSAHDFLFGWLGWWGFLALVTAMALPGLSYLFAWPLLTAVAGFLLVAFWPGGAWRQALPAAAAAVMAALLFAPVANWLWIYTGRAEAMMGLPMAGLPVLFVAPALALLVAAFEMAAPRPAARVTSGGAWRAAGVLLLLALGLFVIPAFAQPSPARPWANAVVYTLDAGSGEAYWLTFNDSRLGRGTRQQLDEWTGQFFPDGAEATTFDPWLLTRSDTLYPALRAPATAVPLPRTMITSTEVAGGVRLTASRPAEAWLTRLVVRSSAPLTGITFDGEALDLGGARPAEYTFLVIGNNAEVVIDVAGAPIGGVVVETLDRLVADVVEVAAQTGLDVHPRPDWMTTAAASDTADGAIVTGRFE